MGRTFFPLLVLLLGLLPALSQAYPLDGYQDTGIRRLEYSRMANEGVIPGGKQPAGALLPTKDVDLRLLQHKDLDLPPPDPEFTRQIVGLLGQQADRYGVAVLDLSEPGHPRYAEHRGDFRQNVGSVGKLVAVLGLFQAMADIWPDDLEQRRRILKETLVTGDDFTRTDHHKARLFDPETLRLVRKVLSVGDTGSLWEWLDWTLSLSSNSAASMVMREAMLMRRYGKDYPPSVEEAQRFFRETPSKDLTELFQKTFFEPVTRNGLDLEYLRQGSFFTQEGKRKVPGGATSYATARELMKLLLRMEQGRLVDEFSSREMKRLLYMTERRIRYASSPALDDGAVYFKSGSLYQCKPEPGFKCAKYQGNVKNYMNSVAIVEYPAGERKLDYMVTLISNVLRKNSAVDHQTLATQIQRIIAGTHDTATLRGHE